MIIDYRSDAGRARQYSVFDAETGECLDLASPYFYADDEQGYLLVRKRDEQGRRYAVDSRTGERACRTNPGMTPGEFLEVAWERIDRRIAIRPRVPAPMEAAR